MSLVSLLKDANHISEDSESATRQLASHRPTHQPITDTCMGHSKDLLSLTQICRSHHMKTAQIVGLYIFELRSVSCSVMSDSLQFHGLQPTKLLCPWNSAGKNTRVGSHSLLQGIFSPQESNPGLLDCRRILYHLSDRGSPFGLSKS